MEAQLVGLACSNPPEGQGRWTPRLLADELVRLEHVESIAHTAVGKTLKNAVKPGQVKEWGIPKAGARLVAKMEAVWDVSARPYDPGSPVLCVDEKAKLWATCRSAMRAAAGAMPVVSRRNSKSKRKVSR